MKLFIGVVWLFVMTSEGPTEQFYLKFFQSIEECEHWKSYEERMPLYGKVYGRGIYCKEVQ